MKNKEKQRKIAEWKLLHAFAESDPPNSYTRAEIIELIKPKKEKMREKLLREYFEAFGENYEGDIIEDVVLDRKSRRALEKLAG